MDLFRGINDNDNSNNNNDGNSSNDINANANAARSYGSARPKFLSMAMPAPQRIVAPVGPHSGGGRDLDGSMKASFGWSGPSMTMMMPNEAFLATDGGKTAQQPSATQSSSSWAPVEKLTRMGYFHPLETTHTKFAHDDLPHVLAGLTQALRQLSCRVEHESDRIVAVAQTMEGVEFQIAIWQERQNNAGSLVKKAQCVLELQRVAGDTICFHRKYAPTLLKVPLQEEQETLEMEDVTMEAAMTETDRYDGMLMDKLAAASMPCPMDEITQALEMACGLVSSDRCDACRLGLESLQSLVDPRVSGWSTALQASQGVVAHQIAQKVWRCAVHDDGAHADSLVALQIWANLWNVLAQASIQDGDYEAASCAMMHLPADVVPALLNHVNRVQTHPHHAALACAALHSLVQLDANIARQISWHTISTAHAVGCAQHVALQAASQQLLQTAAVRS